MTTPFSRPFHYFAVATSTQLLLGGAAVLVLLPTGLLPDLPWRLLAALLGYHILVATLTAVIVSAHTLSKSKAAARWIGLVLGHFLGLVLGGFLGLVYGGWPWAVAVAAILYFAVGWTGSHISLSASAQLTQLTGLRWETDAQKLIRSANRRHRGW